MPAIYHEGSWLGNATDPEVLVKDTVGWTGKNLLPYPYKDSAKTHNGVTYVYNSDNTITANGEATSTSWRTLTEDFSFLELGKKYRLSGCPAGENSNSYLVQLTYNDGVEKYIQDYGDGIEFTYTGGFIRLQVIVKENYTANNLVFKPMICRADITDPTYEPYHPTVEEEIEQIYTDNGVLGAKNLLPSMQESSHTVSGITFTRKSDLSIELNGTSTAEIIYDYVNNDIGLQALRGDWVARLGVESISGMNLVLYKSTSGSWNLSGANLSQAVSLTDAEHLSGRLRLYVANNKTFDHVVIKPTLYLASDPDDTYVPHAMTNRELTEKVTTNSGTVSFSKGTPHTIRTHLDRVGNVCVLSAHVNLMDAEIDASTFVKVGTVDILPQKETMFVVQCAVSNAVLSGHIKTNGDIEIINMQNATVTVNTIMFQCAYITA